MKKYSTQTKMSIQAENVEQSAACRQISWWVSIIVILGALLILVGAVISKVAPTLLTNGSPMTEAARAYADYMFARNLPLAIMLLVLLIMNAQRMLAGFMVLIALIQCVDILDDVTRGALMLVPGLLIFVIAFLLGAWQLFGQALWHRDAWRGPRPNAAS